MKLTGKHTYLLSKVLYELKLREFLREIRKNGELKNLDLDNGTDMGFLMFELVFFVSERLFLAQESIDNLLESAFNADVDNMTHDEKTQAIIDVLKEAVPKTLKDTLEAMGVKKNMKKSKQKKEG